MRRWVIIPANEVNQDMVDVCIQTSLETLRYSIAKDKVVMKYSGDKPDVLKDYTDYSQSDIGEILITDEWSKIEELQ